MRGIGAYIVIFILLVLSLILISTNQTPDKKTKYSTIIGYFESNKISDYSLDLGSGELNLTLNDKTAIKYTVPDIGLFVKRIEPIVDANNSSSENTRINYDYIQAWQAPWWFSFLPYLAVMVIMVLLWFYMMNQAGGGAGGGKVMSFGKARVKQITDEKKKTNFGDVAGADEEKAELQ